jgi:hypothetical protein
MAFTSAAFSLKILCYDYGALRDYQDQLTA